MEILEPDTILSSRTWGDGRSTRFYNDLAAALRANPGKVVRVDPGSRTPTNIQHCLRFRGLEVKCRRWQADAPFVRVWVVQDKGVDTD